MFWRLQSTMAQKFHTSPVWKGYLEAQRSQIPVLNEVDDVSDRVVRLLGCNPGDMQLQGTNTYLVGTGSRRILIDTGEGAPKWALNITSYLEDHDISISHVLLTHWHKDHTGGVDELLAHDPSIRICKHMPDNGQLDIADGQMFQTDGASLRAVFTPGHAIDHMCFLLEEENALFTGDNVLGHGYSLAEDLEAYTASLRVMANQKCTIGYPGHGDVIRNLPRTMANYISQRVSREKQIYAILTSRASSNASSATASDAEDSDDGEIGVEQGLSTTDIGNLMYGEITKDIAMFESAVKPLLNQVLQILLARGKIGTKMVGLDKRWFATLDTY